MALKTASTGPMPSAVAFFGFPSTTSCTVAVGFAKVPERIERSPSSKRSSVCVTESADDGLDVLVEDRLLLVGEILEALEGELEVVAFDVQAELLEPVVEGVPARVLAQHQLVRGTPDRLGRHDLVGDGRLQHAVLVDARLVGEGVVAHDRLVGLHRTCRSIEESSRLLG